MIIDSLANIARYDGICPNILTALNYAREHLNDESLTDGAHVVIPDEVIVHVVTGKTHPRAGVQMELHEKFMDIHVMIRGSEACYVGPVPAAYDYQADRDIALWDCRDTYRCTIGEGDFYAVWPLEAHCPMCSVEDDEPIRKMIIKVKVG